MQKFLWLQRKFYVYLFCFYLLLAGSQSQASIFCSQVLLDYLAFVHHPLGQYNPDYRRSPKPPNDKATKTSTQTMAQYTATIERILEQYGNRGILPAKKILLSLAQQATAGRIENFADWLRYVDQISDEQKRRQIDEGETALAILKTPNVKVRFESQQGSFLTLRLRNHEFDQNNADHSSSPKPSSFEAITKPSDAYAASIDRILKNYGNQGKRAARRILTTLAEEATSGRIGNFEGWLRFLENSNRKQKRHRIYEGQSALFILQSMHVRVNFEPQEGFFRTKGMKSMDLQLVFEHAPQEHAPQDVVAYREVKTCNIYNIGGALKSIRAKILSIEPHVRRDTELGALVYITNEETLPNLQVVQLQKRFQKIIEYSKGYLRKSETPIDHLIIIDAKANLFAIIVRKNNQFESKILPLH